MNSESEFQATVCILIDFLAVQTPSSWQVIAGGKHRIYLFHGESDDLDNFDIMMS
jgi:hypothetical protein